MFPRTIESSTATMRLPRDLVERVELHADALLAHALLGLDERACDVAVLDERLVERDARGLREADRRRGARVRDADDEVRLDRRLPREPLAHADARAVHLDAGEPRVGPCEVDVLEDAERAPARRHRLGGVEPVLVDPDHLARTDVAHELGPDEVERARLRGDDPVVLDPAEREGAEAERVAKRDERALDERRDRVRALETLHRRRDRLGERRRVARDESGDHLRVEARAELHAVREQLVAELLDVHEVAVVAERDRAGAPVVDERLRVRPLVRAGRRVAGVADGRLAGERLQLLLVEDARDEAHLAQDRQVPALGDGDPCRLLPAVLECEQAEVREPRDVPLGRADPEHPAHGRAAESAARSRATIPGAARGR